MNDTNADDLTPLRTPQHGPTVPLRDGGVLDVSHDSWRLVTTTHSTNFIFFEGPFRRLSPELQDYSAERLATKSTSVCMFTLWVWLKHFRRFVEDNGPQSFDWDTFQVKDFMRYREHLVDKGVEYYFWYVQTVVNWLVWHRPGLIKAEVAKEITAWTIEGNTKGEAVALGDPHAGALTRIEAEAIRTAAIAPKCPATLLERIVVLLFLETGSRNEQLCKLKSADFRRVKYVTQGDVRHYDPENAQRFSVLMPSNKTVKGQRDISISQELFALCLEYLGATAAIRDQVRGKPFLIVDPAIHEIYPAWFDADKERWSRIRVPNSWDINSLVRSFCDKCGIANRFGKPLNIFARRFRRTIATRLIEQGASPEHVASFLDHSDVQQVMVYFEFNAARKQERIEEAAGPFFRALGDAAAGRLIANSTKARNPTEVIAFYDKKSQDILGFANCGRDLNASPNCHDSIPFACYGCVNFQPWISDIHEKNLANLEKRREALKEMQGREQGRLIYEQDALIAQMRAVAVAAATAQGRNLGEKS